MITPKTDNDIVDGVLLREGVAVTQVLGDAGGLTVAGLSSRANPDLFVKGLPTMAQVRQRYLERYVQGPGFDQIADMCLRSLLVDYGVLSGPMIAIKALQTVCDVPQDGLLGPTTMAALALLPVGQVVNGVVAERVRMIGRILTKNPSQAKFAAGWLNRITEWLF